MEELYELSLLRCTSKKQTLFGFNPFGCFNCAGVLCCVFMLTQKNK